MPVSRCLFDGAHSIFFAPGLAACLLSFGSQATDDGKGLTQGLVEFSVWNLDEWECQWKDEQKTSLATASPFCPINLWQPVAYVRATPCRSAPFVSANQGSAFVYEEFGSSRLLKRRCNRVTELHVDVTEPTDMKRVQPTICHFETTCDGLSVAVIRCQTDRSLIKLIQNPLELPALDRPPFKAALAVCLTEIIHGELRHIESFGREGLEDWWQLEFRTLIQIHHILFFWKPFARPAVVKVQCAIPWTSKILMTFSRGLFENGR